MRPVLGLALALCAAHASEARACDPVPFELVGAWPTDGASDVPIDGVIVFDLRGAPAAGPDVAVDVAGQPVAGVVTPSQGGLYVWRSDAPLAAAAAHHVVVEGHEFTFTTGAALAPPPPPLALADLVLERYDLELTDCLVEGECGCVTTEVVGLEQRLRAIVTLPPAPAQFGPHDLAAVALVDVGDAPARLVQTARWPTGDLTVAVDFGLPDTWPGDQVCARVSAIDPLGRVTASPALCRPLADITDAPPPEADDPDGCSCAATTAPPPLLALLLLLAFARRRR